jgi:hypothetical protein
MTAQTSPVQHEMALGPGALLLAVIVVAALVIVALVVASAALPTVSFEIPEPALPIYDWVDL